MYTKYAYFAVNFPGVEVLICKVETKSIGSFDNKTIDCEYEKG